MAVQISGNDITVPRDGTFSRNVSIAGTLTYEDVTNIDSVGLITARQGIEVGASPGVGASISVDGNAIFSGITTAATLKATTGIVTTLTATTGIVTTLTTNTLTANNTTKVGSGVTLSPDGDGFFTGVTTATTLHIQDGEISGYASQSGTLLIVEDTGDTSIEVASGHNDTGSIFFGDTGTSNKGQINYLHGTGGDLMTFQTNGGERFRFGSAGQLGIAGANYGTAGQVLKSGGSGAAVSWGAGSDLVAESSVYDMTVFTAGVNADVIDSSTRRISLGFLSWSLSGSDNLRIQLRTSAGTITSGYISRGGYVSNASYAQDQTSSGGFDTYGMSSSGYTWSGWVTLKNYKDNYWYMNADLWADGASTHYWIHGHVNLGAQIAGIRVDTTGSNSFDAREFKIFQYNTP